MHGTRSIFQRQPDDVDEDVLALALALARVLRPKPPQQTEWLSLADAAEVAKTTPRSIRDAARRGELALGRSGRSPVVDRAELDRWIASRAVAPKSAGLAGSLGRLDVEASLHAAARRVGRRSRR